MRAEIARLTGSSQLREVSCVRCCARHARASIGGHQGGTSWSSATSHAQPSSAAANSFSSGRPDEGRERP